MKAKVLCIAGCLAFGFLYSQYGFTQELTPTQQLGKKLFFDKISSPDWMSCASCHDAKVGFTGGIPGINRHGAVYRGAVPSDLGTGNRPVLPMPHSARYFTTTTRRDCLLVGIFGTDAQPARNSATRPQIRRWDHS